MVMQYVMQAVINQEKASRSYNHRFQHDIGGSGADADTRLAEMLQILQEGWQVPSRNNPPTQR